ncbi:MAG: ArgE/DapE family deacylase [Candidatus Omnitrophica bacterium]|nr:ArgE/DapE family deacylase [Candidatus Omnitrophota bacterium]
MYRELVGIVKKLIQIDSQNPPGREKEIALFIKYFLKDIGVDSKIFEFNKNRYNLVCSLPSYRGKKRIILTPHLDTVPVSGKWRFPPFKGKVFKGKIYGRGATDCKGNVGVVMYLIKKLKEEKITFNNLDLIFAFTADEETGSRWGIKPLLKYLKKIDYGIVLDSDDFDIIVAQKGLLHLKIEVFGKEAHGATPHRGINAIEKSIYILRDLLKEKFTENIHPLLKQPTINIGRFWGGEKVNIVAGYAFFEIDIRYIPSIDKETIINKIEKILKKYTNKYKINILAHQEPIEIDRDNLLISILKQTLKSYNIKPKLVPSFGATVITFLKDKGIENFAFGFGSRGCAHIKDEYVKIDNLYKGYNVLKSFLINLDSQIAKDYL